MSSNISAPKLSEAVKTDGTQAQRQFEDCTPCRVMGMSFICSIHTPGIWFF